MRFPFASLALVAAPMVIGAAYFEVAAPAQRPGVYVFTQNQVAYAMAEVNAPPEVLSNPDAALRLGRTLTMTDIGVAQPTPVAFYLVDREQLRPPVAASGATLTAVFAAPDGVRAEAVPADALALKRTEPSDELVRWDVRWPTSGPGRREAVLFMTVSEQRAGSRVYAIRVMLPHL